MPVSNVLDNDQKSSGFFLSLLCLSALCLFSITYKCIIETEGSGKRKTLLFFYVSILNFFFFLPISSQPPTLAVKLDHICLMSNG